MPGFILMINLTYKARPQTSPISEFLRSSVEKFPFVSHKICTLQESKNICSDSCCWNCATRYAPDEDSLIAFSCYDEGYQDPAAR